MVAQGAGAVPNAGRVPNSALAVDIPAESQQGMGASTHARHAEALAIQEADRAEAQRLIDLLFRVVPLSAIATLVGNGSMPNNDSSEQRIPRYFNQVLNFGAYMNYAVGLVVASFAGCPPSHRFPSSNTLKWAARAAVVNAVAILVATAITSLFPSS